jgi:hypothetical protein
MAMVFGGSIRFSTAALRSGEYPKSSSYPAHLRNRGKVEQRTTSLTQGVPDDSRFDEIIVVAHGVPARLQFGRDILDHDSILEGGVLYEGLTRHLAPQGQVTFQSCNLAAGEDGAYFIQTLAEHLGAGVAAATRAVGAKELGGPQVQISM